MIEARDLTKVYGGKAAVDHLSFTVEPGRVTGFLGPNGAGKSTTMRLILGLDRPQTGVALINGKRYRDLRDPLRTVGALLEAKSVHPGRTARNHLLFLAQTQGLPAHRVEEMLALVGLQDVADKRAGGFSLGMSQRLGVAVAMLGDPEILLLDEPVNGLDPEGVLWIRNLMKALAAEGRTILVSSHLMNEMAVTADYLIVVGRGKLITEASTEDVIARSTDKSVRVRTPDADRLAELITAAGGKGGSRRPGGGCRAAHGHRPGVVPDRRACRVRVSRAARADPARLAGRGVHGTDLRQPGVRRARPGSGERGGGEYPMTTTSPVAPTQGPADPAAGRSAGFAGLMRAEWTKIRSVRSTVWTLLSFVVVCVGFTALITWLTETHWYGPKAAPRDARASSTRSASSWAPGSDWGSSPSAFWAYWSSPASTRPG
jgi:ABC-2 type transport system ATP-binding protein